MKIWKSSALGAAAVSALLLVSGSGVAQAVTWEYATVPLETHSKSIRGGGTTIIGGGGIYSAGPIGGGIGIGLIFG